MYLSVFNTNRISYVVEEALSMVRLRIHGQNLFLISKFSPMG
jgi:hypothetical protein